MPQTPEQNGPQTPFSQKLHSEKYRSENETFRDAMSRVASALRDTDEHYHAFRDILLHMRFLPAGRIQAACGSGRNITPYNCFVSGTIGDTLTDPPNSIMDRAREAAQTMRQGGGIGYDFSTLRPRGALIRRLMSHSSGPVSFMSIFDSICRTIASAGHRRGAQMGVMRVDHPDIEEFIQAKNNTDKLTGFNMSVAVTDDFMDSLEGGFMFDLKFDGEIYNTIDPQPLWNAIMRSTWDWGEPGVLFIDTINRLNPLYYCEEIAATNPCGEQPLPPFGACLLGSINLVKYLVNDEVGGYSFDFTSLEDDIPHIVRAMDNVIDKALYPLPQQQAEAKLKRRMGIGVTGEANALEAMGHPYGSPSYLMAMEAIHIFIQHECYRASIELAKEKGSFPMLTKDLYVNGPYISKFPTKIKNDIQKYGLRNSHLTSIAPTGTISLCADNVSSGIEPVFKHNIKRIVQTFEGPEEVELVDYGFANLDTRGKTYDEVTVQEHLAVLQLASSYSDSAVSKTINVPSDLPWHDFKNLYVRAWKNGCKGLTTFQPDGKRTGIMSEGETCIINPETGEKDCG